MSEAGPEVIALVERFMAEGCPFNSFLGIEVARLAAGFARLEIPFRPELIGNPDVPALHGGVLSTLIDVTGGAASMTLIDLRNGAVSTIDLRVDYLRPGRPHRLVAESTITRMGNRVASVDTICFHSDEPDRLIATGKAAYNINRKN